MVRSKVFWVVLFMIVASIAASLSFRYGVRAERAEENRSLASTQAMLAFGHHKSYERIASLLARKCYEAALTEATELQTLELHLVSENLRASDNDPGLVEYIKLRDPKLLETIVAGHVPEPKSYTVTCP